MGVEKWLSELRDVNPSGEVFMWGQVEDQKFVLSLVEQLNRTKLAITAWMNDSPASPLLPQHWRVSRISTARQTAAQIPYLDALTFAANQKTIV